MELHNNQLMRSTKSQVPLHADVPYVCEDVPVTLLKMRKIPSRFAYAAIKDTDKGSKKDTGDRSVLAQSSSDWCI